MEGAHPTLSRRSRTSDGRGLQKLAAQERVRGALSLRRSHEEKSRRNRRAPRGGARARSQERSRRQLARKDLPRSGELAETRAALGKTRGRGVRQRRAGNDAESSRADAVAQARAR